MVFVFPRNDSSYSSTRRKKVEQEYSNADLLLLNGGINMEYAQNDNLHSFEINYFERDRTFTVFLPAPVFSKKSKYLSEIINFVIDYLQHREGKTVKGFSILPFKTEISDGETHVSEFILMVRTSDAQ